MRSESYDPFVGGFAPGQFGAALDDEKKQLRRQSIRTGLCLIAFFLIQQALVILLFAVPTALQLFREDAAVQDVIEMLIYICSMFLPFYLAYRLMNRQEQAAVCVAFGSPTSAGAAAAAIVACFFFCTVGDYATNMLLDFMEQLGFSVSGGSYVVPTTPAELIGSLLQIAVLPALVEEFAMRGIVLQPMRRFGDRYAILMSAFVFALMHGNMVQIPFAFVAGVAFGYYTLATGSVWVGVLAHFVNNAYSVILNYLVEVRPTAADTLYQVMLSVTLVAGLIAIVMFWKVLPHHRLRLVPTALSGGEKTAKYLLTIPMVIAIIYLVVQTVQLIDYVGA